MPCPICGGDSLLLNFVSSYLALSYLTFAILVTLGALQFVATHQGWQGLSLLDCSGRKAVGYALSVTLVVAGYVWFFLTRREIFSPGPAGAELMVLFSAASFISLSVSLMAASIRGSRSPAVSAKVLGSTLVVQPVCHAQVSGLLIVPPYSDGPVPAVCGVPGPGMAAETLSLIAARLAEENIATLAIDLAEKTPGYPEILALFPAALSYLTSHPGINPDRLGALGFDLGGDVAIRAASGDRQIAAVAALAPLWKEAATRTGLTMLREMSYWQALQYSRQYGRAAVLRQLDSVGSLPALTPRPVLFLYGERDGVVSLDRVRALATGVGERGTLRVIREAGHLDLLTQGATAFVVAQWFKENL